MISTTTTSHDLGCNPTVVAPVFTLTLKLAAQEQSMWLMAAFWGTGCAKSQHGRPPLPCVNNVADNVTTYTWTEDLVKPVISTTATAMTLDVATQPWLPRYLP
ncbi:MAG: hypothetical protein U0Z17_07445 [Bacteroidales bacterium]